MGEGVGNGLKVDNAHPKKQTFPKMNAPSTPRTTRTIRTPARPQRPVRIERAQNLHMSRVNTIRPRALFVENN